MVVGDFIDIGNRLGISWPSWAETTTDLLSIIFLIVIIYFLYRWISNIREQRAEVREEKRAGSTYQTQAAKTQAIQEAERTTRAAEKAARKETKSAPKGKQQRAAIATEAEAERESEVEEATEDIQQTAIAVQATLEATTNEVLEIVREELAVEKVEEVELENIAVLKKRLDSLNKNKRIDSTTVTYLQRYFESLEDHLLKQDEYEENSVEKHQQFVEKLKKTLNNLTTISEAAKKKAQKLKRKEGREKRSFKKELSTVQKSIKDKRKKLNSISKEKKASPAVIAQLKREIQLLEQNSRNLAGVEEQLTKSHEMIDLEIGQLRKLLQDVVTIAKNQKRKAKKLDQRDKDLKQKIENLSKNKEKITTAVKNLKNPEQIYDVVIKFSIALNDYFNFYIQSIKENISFEEILKEITIQNFLLLRKMTAVDQVLISLDQTEEAIDEGTGAIIKIVQIIYSDDISGSLQEEKKNILEQIAILESEVNVEKTMRALEQESEQKEREALALIEELIVKEKKRAAENEATYERNTNHLGQSMATMVNRKVAIDEKYSDEMLNFEQQLQKHNEQASAAYQQALKS